YLEVPRSGDREAPVHARGVRIALVLVGPLLQGDVPRRRARAADARHLVDAGAHQVEVVNRALVVDDDRVRTGLQLRDALAGRVLERDLEVRADGAGQLRGGRGCAGHDERGREGCDEDEAADHAGAPFSGKVYLSTS